MKHRFSYYISLIIILLASALILLVSFWLFWPYKVAEVETPLKVMNSPVEKGQHIIAEIHFCKYKDVVGVANTELINTLIYHLPTSTGKAPVGCYEKKISWQIPQALPSGNYFLRESVVYQVNPLKKITISFETEKFEVKE